MKRIKSIESDQIRKVAEHLNDQGISITFFGKAWSGCTNNWIYFDAYLDLDDLKRRFNLNEDLKVHENRDPKSGMEKGFIDKVTGEAIMGKLKLD